MQMVSDVPIGAFLSGGIDSSRRRRPDVETQQRRRSRRIRSASAAAAPTTSTTSCRTRKAVAERFGTDHHEILVKPDVVSLLPKLLWHMDEPIADTAFITTYLVSQFARRDVTVILSGVGGDEILGGYRRYLGDHYHRRFATLPGLGARSRDARGPKPACATGIRRCSICRVTRRASSRPPSCRPRSATVPTSRCFHATKRAI